jgi:membrane-associated protein
VYLTITAGSIGGGLAVYAFGRAIGQREERWPRFLRGERTHRAIMNVRRRFERHGAAYLAVNRFVPALRAVFFVAAGLAELPVWKVALFGGISAAAWNALILGVGYSVGNNWERLLDLSERYTLWSLAAVGALALVLLVRWLWKRRSATPES